MGGASNTSDQRSVKQGPIVDHGSRENQTETAAQSRDYKDKA
jgi:hypothetical protein